MPMLTTVLMRLPVTPIHSPLRTLRAKVYILSSSVVHQRHHVLAVDLDLVVCGVAQRGVQDGPVLGDVDLASGEHGLPPRRQVDLLGQRQQRATSTVSSTRFFDRSTNRSPASWVYRSARSGIVGERLPQVEVEAVVQGR